MHHAFAAAAKSTKIAVERGNNLILGEGRQVCRLSFRVVSVEFWGDRSRKTKLSNR
jgi:hypothetical protein